MKRMLALFLSVLMLLSMMMPIGALAADENVPSAAASEIPEQEQDAEATGEMDVVTPAPVSQEESMTAPPTEAGSTEQMDTLPADDGGGDGVVDGAPPIATDSEPGIPPVADAVATPTVVALTNAEWVIGGEEDLNVDLPFDAADVSYSLTGADEYEELVLEGSGENPCAKIEATSAALYASWLNSLMPGEYTVRFIMDTTIAELRLTVMTYEEYMEKQLPPEEEIGEDGLTDAERENVARVQGLIDALPYAPEVALMDNAGQNEVYTQVQAVYDEFSALSPLEQLLIDSTRIEDLFNYFNALIMPMSNTTATLITGVFTSQVGRGTFVYHGTGGDYTVAYGLLTTGINRHRVDGQVVYCMCPDRALDTGTGYREHDSNNFWNYWLNNDQRRAIRTVLFYGYPNCLDRPGHSDHSNDTCEAATQVAIWEIVTGQLNPNTFEHNSTSVFYSKMASVFKEKLDQIYALCQNDQRHPSFVTQDQATAHEEGRVIKLDFNPATGLYEKVVEDTNHSYVTTYKSQDWYLAKFTYPTKEGWTFTPYTSEGKNYLKITATVAAICDTSSSTFNPKTGAYEFEMDVKTPYGPDSIKTKSVQMYVSNATDDWPYPLSDPTNEFQVVASPATLKIDPIDGFLVIEGVPKFPIEVTKKGSCFYTAVEKGDGSGYEMDWEELALSGAVFDVVAAENITSRDGSVTFHNKGDVVVSDLTAGDDGKVRTEPLYVGKYNIVEKKAPYGFTINDDPDGDGNPGLTVEMKWPDQQQGGVIQVYEVTFKDEPITADLSIIKKDDETQNNVIGSPAVFGLYAAEDIKGYDKQSVVIPKNALIEKVTTDGNGKAQFKSKLPFDASFYVKEIEAPKGYVLNTSEIYNFTYSYIDDSASNAHQVFSHNIPDTPVKAAISFKKEDIETGNDPQGDATFVGAVYGLYAREDIIHPDGYTNNPEGGDNIHEKAPGLLYSANDLVARLTTAVQPDGSVGAQIDNLYLGKYYLKEISAPTGYTLDKTEYDLDCSYVDQSTPQIVKTTTVKEQVIKQVFHLIKVVKDGETNDNSLSQKLDGAGFSFWLVSDLKAAGYTDVDEQGVPVVPAKEGDSYPVQPIVVTESGGREVFSNSRGYVETIGIPYGTYVVSETTVPHNFVAIHNFVITIPTYDEDDDREFPGPQEWGVAADGQFKALLKIIKVDGETKRTVLWPNAQFRVFDIDNDEYVIQHMSYPENVDYGTAENPFTTTEDGTLQLVDDLNVGHYRIEEVHAPEFYLRNEQPVQVFIDQNTPYHYDGASKMFVIDVEFTDYPEKGKLTVVKKGEILSGFNGDFEYTEANLAGAEFKIIADENIYTADNQIDENGNRRTGPHPYGYAKGEVVATITTDERGTASVDKLPMGRYRVVEEKAPGGYALPEEDQTVTFVYVDENTPVVEMTATVTDYRQHVKIRALKKDNETGTVLSGAEFALYAAEDIHGGPYYAPTAEVVVKAGTELARATSGMDGVAEFDIDLPLAKYYVVETKAPDGFVSVGNDSIEGNERIDVDATYQGQTVYTAEFSAEVKNNPTKVRVVKSDATTGVELTGAHLQVIDEDNHIIDDWVSDKSKEHIITGLVVGKTYTLREELAPYGYLQASEVKFTVLDTDQIQQVEMKDEVPTAKLMIDKTGEFLSEITPLKSVEGWIQHLFSYVFGKMSDVTFDVYAAADIVAADGVSPNYFDEGDLVATITTGSTGVAVLEEVEVNGKTIGLPLGKYKVIEKETLNGFMLDGEPRYVDLLYVDQNTPVVSYSEGWQNARQRMEVKVIKVDSSNDVKRLPGALFALYAGENILGTDGEVLMKANTLIEERVTGDDGTLMFVADLPYGYTYYIQERSPAPGYATNHDAQAFTFELDNGIGLFQLELTVSDEITKVDLSKKDLTTGEEVPGNHLVVKDKDGNIVDEWVSGEEPHRIEGLVVGETYMMEETQPADGYTTAESVEFTVQDTGVTQEFEMFNDVTKVRLSKKDATTGEELPGAHLKLVDEDGNVVDEWVSTDEPHYMEKLVVGKTYTLHEDLAPLGYATASDVTFTVKDTNDVQEVEMKDEITKVDVSKKDATTGEELPGAHLQVLDKDGNIVDEWVSGEEPHHIEGLLVGETYTLHEDLAPLGYATASDVEFVIEDSGEIQQVEMKDEITKVQVSKQNISGQELPGASLQVLDKDGKVVDEWVSGEEPHMIEGLTVGETYTLHESLAPLGYEKATDVEFVVEDTGGVQSVEMVDELSPTGTPKTADDGGNLGLLLALSGVMVAAAGAAFAAKEVHKRKRNSSMTR